MKNSNIEVARVVVKMGDTEVTLTPAEAKELHKVLGEMFGAKETPVYYPVYPTYPVHPRVYPHWDYTYTSTESGGQYTVNCLSNMSDGGN